MKCACVAPVRHQHGVHEAVQAAAVSVLVPGAVLPRSMGLHGHGHGGRLPAHVRVGQVGCGAGVASYKPLLIF